MDYKLSNPLGKTVIGFQEKLDFEDPDLAASLNHNFSLAAYAEKDRDKVKKEYAKLIKLLT